MAPLRRPALLIPFASIILASASCSTLRLAAVGPLIEDVAAATARHDDVDLATQAAPTYLLLIEGLLEGSPDNERLLLAAAEAYTSYGALVESDDPVRARRLYARARDHAIRALAHNRRAAALLEAPYSEFTDLSKYLDDGDLPAVFWAASTWGAWISLSTDSMAALADMPRVIYLMEWVLERDETYYHAAPHLFLGMYHAAVPPMLGGDPKLARAHFQRALDLTGGRALMVQVQMARFYARQVYDRELFVRLLEQVIQSPADGIPELTLQNRVAQTRATELLERVDELF